MRWLFSQGLSGRKVIWSCPVEHEDSWEAWQPEALVRNSRNDTNPSLQFPTTISLSMVTIGSFIKNNFTYFSLLGLCWLHGFFFMVFRLLSRVASVIVEHRLNSYDTRALLLCGMRVFPYQGSNLCLLY